MSKVLLSVHVLAAIVLIGPVTVATSLFPRAAREALADRDRDLGVLRWLYRISRVYAVLALAVPAFGAATAARMGVLGQAWLTAAIVLTAAAVGLLFLAVLPAQQRLVALAERGGAVPEPAAEKLLRRAAMAAGGFALSWAVVTVLMIVRPGSTTGA